MLCIIAILIYLFPSPYTLIIARFIAGIASATWVNFTILYISYHSEEDSNKAVGIITSNSKLGQLIGMLAGGFLAVKFGLRSVFLLSIGDSFGLNTGFIVVGILGVIAIISAYRLNYR